MTSSEHHLVTSRSGASGAIAAGHDLTADAGAAILAAGGTAVDAAIAAVAMACVCEPVLASPGGAGFAMLRDRDGGVELVDFFAHTPKQHQPGVDETGIWSINADFGTASQPFMIGPAAAATPGFFAGLEVLHSRYATMPLADLFAPAIRAARQGITINGFQGFLAQVMGPPLVSTPQARAVFAVDGHVIAEGSSFRNPGLANAFETIAAGGADEVVAACVAAQAGQGHLTADDFAHYEAVVRKPLVVPIGGGRVYLNPLPAAGGVLIEHVLGQLSDAEPLSMAVALDATDRFRLSGAHLAGLDAASIRQRGTTHISVIDRHGAVCSLTMSNGEGNGEMAGEWGFMLNNILGEDDVNPAGTNWTPDVRLSSMMCPTMIEHADGRLTALGSGGSNRIRSAIAQTVARVVWGHASLAEAIVAGRVHPEDGHLDLEDQLPAEAIEALCKQFPDHRRWPEPNMFFGGVHAVSRAADGAVDAFGDPRRAGAGRLV